MCQIWDECHLMTWISLKKARFFLPKDHIEAASILHGRERIEHENPFAIEKNPLPKPVLSTSMLMPTYNFKSRAMSA